SQQKCIVIFALVCCFMRFSSADILSCGHHGRRRGWTLRKIAKINVVTCKVSNKDKLCLVEKKGRETARRSAELLQGLQKLTESQLLVVSVGRERVLDRDADP
ncbi:hypothetical protein STEG23_021565, partial [Scotinomys teguina]